MKKSLVIGLIILVIISSVFVLGRLGLSNKIAPMANSTQSMPDYMADRDVAMEESKSVQEPGQVGGVGDKVIRNVSYEIRSKAFDQDLAFLTELPKQFGGEAEQIDQGTGYYTEPNQRYFNVTYRIPTDKLNDFMAALEKDRVIYHKSFNQYNVTDSYNQTEARLKTYLATQERYNELLKKAEDINDIITIEQALANVTSEIEWLSNQKDSYDKDINYTAVSAQLIEVSASQTLSGQQSFWDELKDAFISGVATFFEGLRQLMLLILQLWPILVIIGLGIILYLKRRKKHNPTE